MYPELETERLLLRLLQENDLEDMYALYSNSTVAKMMEHSDSIYSYEKYKKEFPNLLTSDPEFGVLDKLPDQAKLRYYWEVAL